MKFFSHLRLVVTPQVRSVRRTSPLRLETLEDRTLLSVTITDLGGLSPFALNDMGDVSGGQDRS